MLKEWGCGIGKCGDERLFGGRGRLWEVMRWLMGWEREGMGDGGLVSFSVREKVWWIYSLRFKFSFLC